MSNFDDDFINDFLESYNSFLNDTIKKATFQIDKIIEFQISSYIDSIQRLSETMIRNNNAVLKSIESIQKVNIDAISLVAKQSIQNNLETVIKANVINSKVFLNSYVDEMIASAANNVVDQLENIKSDEIVESTTSQNLQPVKKHTRWTRGDVLSLISIILSLIMFVFPNNNDQNITIENIEVNIINSEDNVSNPPNKLIESVSSLIQIIDDIEPELLHQSIDEVKEGYQENSN